MSENEPMNPGDDQELDEILDRVMEERLDAGARIAYCHPDRYVKPAEFLELCDSAVYFPRKLYSLS